MLLDMRAPLLREERCRLAAVAPPDQERLKGLEVPLNGGLDEVVTYVAAAFHGLVLVGRYIVGGERREAVGRPRNDDRPHRGGRATDDAPGGQASRSPATIAASSDAPYPARRRDTAAVGSVSRFGRT